jgi:hypothetical protein
LFRELHPDQEDALDGVLDKDNMPLQEDPAAVIEDLEGVGRSAT